MFLFLGEEETRGTLHTFPAIVSESEIVPGGAAAPCVNPTLSACHRVTCPRLSLFVRLLPEQCRAVGLRLARRPASGLHGSMAATPAGLTGVSRLPDTVCLLVTENRFYLLLV